MNWLVVLATWFLMGTAPSHVSGREQPCPLGCRDSSENPTPGVRLASLYVVRHRQAPAWVAHGADIVASPDSAARWWPVVRAEAEWQGYAVIPFPADSAGRTFKIGVADSTLGWFYAVCGRDSAGNTACISNEVTH